MKKKTIEVNYTWYGIYTRRLKVEVPDDYDPNILNDGAVEDEVEEAVEEAATDYDSSHHLHWEINGGEWEVAKHE